MNKTWPLKSAPVEEIKLLQWIRDACQCRWKPCNYICTHIESYTYKWRINKQVDKKIYTLNHYIASTAGFRIHLSIYYLSGYRIGFTKDEGVTGKDDFSRKNATDFNWRSKINFQFVVAGCWAHWKFEHASEVISKFPEGQWGSKFFPRFFLLCSS